MLTMKRLLSLTLAVSLSLSLAAPAGAAEKAPAYSDTAGHWAEAAIHRWSSRGVVQGDGGAFRPDDSLTRAELAAMLDRVMGYQTAAENTFSDLGENWYTQSLLHLAAAGVLEGAEGRIRPGDPLTRQEAAVILARAFQVEEDGAALPFSDKADVAPWAAGAVSALAGAGYIQGCDGAFDPAGNVTRASLVTILDNMVSDVVTGAGTYTQNAAANLVVSTPDAALKDLTVKGDLIIADAVGNGDVTLENVKVEGRLIIRGGGERSIHIAGDASQYPVVIVTKTASGKVRLVNESGVPIPMVNVADGRDGVTLEGAFTGVVIASDVPVVADGGKIDSLTVAVPNADLTLGKDAQVDRLDIHQDAAGAALAVEGTVGELSTAARETKIAISGQVEKVFAAETAAASAITVEKGGKVTGTISVKAPVAVDNSGSIKKVEIGASGVTINGKKPSTVKVDKDVDKPTDSKGETIQDTSSSSGGGGDDGGSSTPSITTLSAVAANLASPQAGKTATDATPAGIGYTVTTAWAPALVEGKFEKGTAYTATLTFTPAAYHQWSADILENVAVNNSTSYGNAPKAVEAKLINDNVVLTAQYEATVSKLEIKIDSQNIAAFSLLAESYYNTNLAVFAHVEADGIRVENYQINYQWYQLSDDEFHPITNETMSRYMLPAKLSPGDYSYFCRMTLDDDVFTETQICTVTILDHQNQVTLSNPHLVSTGDRGENCVHLSCDSSVDCPIYYLFEFWNNDTLVYSATYYTAGPLPITFLLCRGAQERSFTVPSEFTVSHITLTPINIESIPIGETLTFPCTLNITLAASPSDVTATYDPSTTFLSYSGVPENFAFYHFYIKDDMLVGMDLSPTHHSIKLSNLADSNLFINLCTKPGSITRIFCANSSLISENEADISLTVTPYTTISILPSDNS